MKWFGVTIAIWFISFNVFGLVFKNALIALDSSFLVLFVSLVFYESKKSTENFLLWLVFTILFSSVSLVCDHLGFGKLPTRPMPLDELWLTVPYTLVLSGIIAHLVIKQK